MARINYVEMPVQQVAGARDFYGKAFGWTFTDYGPDYAAMEGTDVAVGLNGSDDHPVPRLLALIEVELKKRGVEYALLTGQTRDRRSPVKDFQSGKRQIFLISLKAGGVGLNLTEADTVIHYDPWWNPATENQATDRAYRIGQEKPVFVYKLIARGTVEEKIQHLQKEKSDLAAGVLDGRQAGDWKMQNDDIEALFAPLPDKLEKR